MGIVLGKEGMGYALRLICDKYRNWESSLRWFLIAIWFCWYPVSFSSNSFSLSFTKQLVCNSGEIKKKNHPLPQILWETLVYKSPVELQQAHWSVLIKQDGEWIDDSKNVPNGWAWGRNELEVTKADYTGT